MGGKSTSHKAVLSGKKTSKSSGFDLHSWQGLTKVLKQGKESLKDAGSYAEFRNLVLEYAQGGGDVELRKQIDKVIESFEKENVAPQQDPNTSRKRRHRTRKKKKQSPHVDTVRKDLESDVRKESVEQDARQTAPIAAPNPVGERRAKPPSFKASSAQDISEPSRTPTPPPPPVDLPVEEKRVPEPQTPPVPVKKPIPNTTEPTQPAVRQAAETHSVPEEQGVTTPTQKAEPQAQTPSSLSTTPAAEDGSFKSIDEHKARIVEIKRLVHEKIGNPAALMSSHNDLGKKYMMALLAAIKSTGPGSPESPDSAMSRLEDAYKALVQTPPSTSTEVPEKQDSRPEPKKEKTIESEVSVTERPVAIEEDLPKFPKEAPVPQKPRPSEPNKQVPASPQPKPPIPQMPTTVAKPIPEPSVEEKKVQVPQVQPVPAKKTEETPIPKPVEIKIHAQTKKEIDSEEPIETENSKSKLAPVSTLKALLADDKSEVVTKQEGKPSEKPIKEPKKDVTKVAEEGVSSMPKTDIRQKKHTKKEVGNTINSGYQPVDGVNPAKVAVKQTEISSPEVSDALHHLLHEWKIFKSSGLLGIGPSGHEHPLYEKLAPLSMGEVVAGRWEGSDRKVTKMIKEYVDAWRHEQGVAYNIQETFDHYLRRVVLRIQQRETENK